VREPLYKGFLGTWTLDPASCVYEQSDPPKAATYRISLDSDVLSFTSHWEDAAGKTHQMTFSGVADGIAHPFAGGDLVDAMEIRAVSERELTTLAYWQGREIMLAQRQLDDTGRAMRMTQIVRYMDGNEEANVGVYQKNSQA